MAGCLYGADGSFACPGANTDNAQDLREGFFAAFVGHFDTPHQYIPGDLSASQGAIAAASDAHTASSASIVQSRTVAELATKAAAVQQSDWGAVQIQAATASKNMNSQASAQMADELAFVSAKQAADALLS